jgi:uncharacterized membrane protein YfcA
VLWSATVRTVARAEAVSEDAAGRSAARLLDPQLGAIGLAAGVLSGLLGVGGGVVMVPLLVLWAGLGQRDAHAVSLGAIVPISIAGVLAYGAAGEVRLAEAAALAAGSIVGARMGAGLLARADERPLRLLFGLFLVGVAALMFLRR